ncbi:hypothetical protein SLS54_007555 [Diplodia seriata]
MTDPGAPHLWIQDAFSVTACITLCLDLFYRDPNDFECTESRHIVEEALESLQNAEDSMIAQRGARLVSLLLAKVQKPSSSGTENTNKRKASDWDSIGSVKRLRRFDMDAFISAFYEDSQESTPSSPVASAVTAPQSPDQWNDSLPAEKPSDVDESYTHRLLREAENREGLRSRTSNDMLSPRGNFENVSSLENLLFLAQTYNL